MCTIVSNCRAFWGNRVPTVVIKTEVPLLNISPKSVNGVTLRGQNLSLKFCQSYES